MAAEGAGPARAHPAPPEVTRQGRARRRRREVRAGPGRGRAGPSRGRAGLGGLPFHRLRGVRGSPERCPAGSAAGGRARAGSRAAGSVGRAPAAPGAA